MVYGDNGDNGDNGGECLILLLLFLRGYIPFLLLVLFEEDEMLYIFIYYFFFFPLRWVSCTPNSTVGHLSIFTSLLTLFHFFFSSRFRALAPFYFLVIFFFSRFRALAPFYFLG